MKFNTRLVTAISAATVLCSTAVAQSARDQISVVGSSTVFPFATVVAERFGQTTKHKTPKIESTGSGGGMKLFCNGLGVEHPDVTNSSRRIKKGEFENCQANGVTDIIEVLIGFDGITLANSVESDQIELSRKDVFLALAMKVPDPAGGDDLIDNPYKKWSDVRDDLPEINIEVIGPPPTSGTRDAFVELAMEGGCKEIEALAALKETDSQSFKEVCHTVREDGAFIEAGENDNLIVQKLEANPDALGIFGFSFLEQNSDLVQPSLIDGFEPTFESISDGSYPVSRPLYFYVKKAHIGVIPGIKEYLTEFTSEGAWGEEGYLADKGMIPLDEETRTKSAESIAALEILTLE